MAATLPPTEYRYQLAPMDQGTSIGMIVVNVVLPIIATVFVVLTCKTNGAPWQANDFVLIAALVSNFIQDIVAIPC